jgi:hypothetical protein
MISVWQTVVCGNINKTIKKSLKNAKSRDIQTFYSETGVIYLTTKTVKDKENVNLTMYLMTILFVLNVGE